MIEYCYYKKKGGFVMFTLSDEKELSVLHKAVLEAKFSVTAQNEELASSPILAGISNKLYDELCNIREKKNKDEGALFRELRRIKNGDSYRGFYYDAVINARRDFIFLDSDEETKHSIAKCYLSPFNCYESELGEFVAEVEKTEARSLKELNPSDLKKAALMKLIQIDEDTVEIKLWLTSKKLCDIVFYNVSGMEIRSKGKRNGMPLILEKVTLKSDKEEVFEADFSAGAQKKSIKISAAMTDIRGI